MKQFSMCMLYFLVTISSINFIHSSTSSQFNNDRRARKTEDDALHQKTNVMDSHHARIISTMQLNAINPTQEQYELYNKKNLAKESFFKNGSYVVTKFDIADVEPIETRLYELISGHFINTKLAIYNQHGGADVHTIDKATGDIITEKIRPLLHLDALFQREAQPKEYILDISSLKIKQKRSSRFIDKVDEEFNNLDIQDIENSLIELARQAHELGDEVNIIEIE